MLEKVTEYDVRCATAGNFAHARAPVIREVHISRSIHSHAAGPIVGAFAGEFAQSFDPEFCERSSNSFDTGDNGGANVNFNTVFTLYNPSATPYSLGSYTVNTAVSYPGDSSTATNDGQSGATHSCSSYYVTGSGGNYKGQWLPFASIAAVAGSYRLTISNCTFTVKSTGTATPSRCAGENVQSRIACIAASAKTSIRKPSGRTSASS